MCLLFVAGVILKNNRVGITLVVLCAGYSIFVGMGNLFDYLLFLLDDQNVQFLTIYWIIVLALLLPIPFMFGHHRDTRGKIICWRKFFHFVSVILFSPPVMSQDLIEYTAFAGVCILCLFVVLETLRVSGIGPRFLCACIKPFLDSKDKHSKIITSPMELLFSCIFPFWMANVFGGTWRLPKMLIAGILSVGIGDSAAAIGGVNSKKPHKVPFVKSRKSIEGFLSFVTATLVCLILADMADRHTVIAVFAAAISEAYIQKFDNLVVPFVYAISIVTTKLVFHSSI